MKKLFIATAAIAFVLSLGYSYAYAEEVNAPGMEMEHAISNGVTLFTIAPSCGPGEEYGSGSAAGGMSSDIALGNGATGFSPVLEPRLGACYEAGSEISEPANIGNGVTVFDTSSVPAL